MFLEFFENVTVFMYMYVLNDFYLTDLNFLLISFKISQLPLSLNLICFGVILVSCGPRIQERAHNVNLR